MTKLKYILIVLFFTQMMFSQLSDFNLSVTATNETCTANGNITITVSNTTPGATILYSIYKLPDITTPISVQSSTSLTGLTAGTYRVIATQSLGSSQGVQQQDVTVNNQIVPLVYSVTGDDEVCSYDGKITVTMISGVGLQYEIFAGPVIKPLQTSNVFTGLTAGVYQVRVFGVCNQGITRTFTLFKKNTELNLALTTPSLSGCNMASIGFSLASVLPEPEGMIKYPLQITTTITPSSGAPIQIQETINTGGVNLFYSVQTPYVSTQTYTYSFSVTDGCGVNYILNGTIQGLSTNVSYSIIPQDCTHKAVKFLGVTALTLTSAPSGYTGTVPQNFTPQIVNNEITVSDLTAGVYVFNATNLCGVQQIITVTINIEQVFDPYYILFNRNCQRASAIIYNIKELVLISCPSTHNVALPYDYTSLINSANYTTLLNLPIGTYIFSTVNLCDEEGSLTIIIEPVSQPPTVTVLEGCEDGVGTLKITGQIQTIKLVNAPATFPIALPYDYTGSLLSNGNSLVLVLDTLPPGTYVFETLDNCSVTHTNSVVIQGYSDDTYVEVQANCSSFNLTVNHSSTNNVSEFWLQKFDPDTNTWGHPFTGTGYSEGSFPNAVNSYLLDNDEVNYNLATLGRFRIVKSYRAFIQNSSEQANCIRILDEFEFDDRPKIESVYSLSCGNNYEVMVNAIGTIPLLYRIVAKNGEPFLFENGNSGLFTGLESAIYMFEVEDSCHNTVNSLFEVLNPNPLEITTDSIFCNGEQVQLTVPNFDFIQYQWWKGNNTASIISTANSLVFPNFNSTIHNGIYYVRITYPNNPNSCLNQVLTYTIDVNTTLPNAGQGGTFSYCGNQGIIDLNSLLSGTFDADGVWTEITSSGTLSANLWNAANVALASYSFTYRVNGDCNLFDEAIINITLKEIPGAPIVSSDAIICETGELNLYASTIPSVIYNWVGPNGFSSTEQNPVIENISNINNGVYTVNVILNECPSETSSIEIAVNELPKFELFQNCINNEYVLSYEIQNNDATVENDYSFSWFGPNGFLSNESQVTITRSETGIYGVTITDQNSCSATKEMEVIRTICEIPNVITPNDDGSNDSLDLTGFGVKKIEIYNRWGRLVYDKENYNNEWHGQNSKGESLPDSTYFYLIQLENETSTKTGWIYVTKG
jgi:gliding motility-associated-like protein